MKTFWVQTLGCKVNQYESDQVAALLRARGLVEASDPARADLRVVNTCSVTVEASAKSRQAARRAVALPQFAGGAAVTESEVKPLGADPSHDADVSEPPADQPARRARVIVTGCWATGDREAARRLPGVDAVLTHHDDVAVELDRLLVAWRADQQRGEAGVTGCRGTGPARPTPPAEPRTERHRVAESSPPPKPDGDDYNGWITKEAGLREGTKRTSFNKSNGAGDVNGYFQAAPGEGLAAADCAILESPQSRGSAVAAELPALRRGVAPGFARSGAAGSLGSGTDIRPYDPTERRAAPQPVRAPGTTSLPLLDARQTGRQRALLKIQDGCDAHCTYCIIPRLRPALWSKPVEDAVREAGNLVASGHVELVLTGIFLGAYGQPTALRRRQPGPTARPLGELVAALCSRVPGLRRLRLSSLEPGDLTPDLIAVLRSFPQVVPHFHLPLQSGSDVLLRRMNRQYTRGDFLRMTDQVRAAFDRPALTTDIIVGFPGETDDEFARTLEVVDAAGFIHVHAFGFSPRPGTAAARWTRQFVHGGVVRRRIETLRQRAGEHSLRFRRQFVGEIVQLLIERDEAPADGGQQPPPPPHGRCERYFPVHFDPPGPRPRPGDFVRVRIDHVTPGRTHGTLLGPADAGAA